MGTGTKVYSDTESQVGINRETVLPDRTKKNNLTLERFLEITSSLFVDLKPVDECGSPEEIIEYKYATSLFNICDPYDFIKSLENLTLLANFFMKPEECEILTEIVKRHPILLLDVNLEKATKAGLYTNKATNSEYR